MQDNDKFPIYIMGKRYEVPTGLTILKALEYSGFKITRGCGCRGGVCGACATMYRKKGDYRCQYGLACQTVVEPGMVLVQLPYISHNRAIYSINNVASDEFEITKLYPELLRCMGCNTCTKSCPMELEVMNYISAAIQGDFKTVVNLSMECVMCGLCAARCPAEITPYNIALLIRRTYSLQRNQPAPHLTERVKSIDAGAYVDELNELKSMDKSQLQEKFKTLQATKGESV